MSALVGTLGAIAAGIAAMMSNLAKHEATDAKDHAAEATQAVKSLEERQKTIAANYAFSEFFLKYLDKIDIKSAEEGEKTSEEITNKKSNESNGQSEKAVEKTGRKVEPRTRQRGMLSALEIVAKASSTEEGDSPAELRATLPLYLALVSGDAGAVAAMDEELLLLDRWKTVAVLDESDMTRITAIKALISICDRAWRRKNLQLLERGVDAIHELADATYKEKTTSAVEENAEIKFAKGDLMSRLLVLQTDILRPKRGATELGPGDAAAVETKLPQRIATDLNAAVFWNKSAEAAVNAIVIGVDTNTGKTVKKSDQEQEQARGALEDLKEKGAAVEDTKLKALEAPIATAGQPPVLNRDQQIAKLLKDLEDKDEKIRREARQKLALFGQVAVQPIVQRFKRLIESADLNSRMLIGLSSALSRMRQPITLDEDDARTIVPLLGIDNPETRLATLDFLINLEDQNTIHVVYKVLKESVDNLIKADAPKDFAVINSVTVIAGWATALNDRLRDTTGKKPMKELALTTVKQWRAKLENKSGWEKIVARIDEMSLRADKRAQEPSRTKKGRARSKR